MKISNAFIIGFDSWHLGLHSDRQLKIYPYSGSVVSDKFVSLSSYPKSIIAPYKISRFATGKDEPESYLYSVDPNDILIEVESWWNNKRSVPDFWKDKIHSTYLSSLIQQDEYLTWRAIAILQPDRILTLLNDIKDVEGSNAIDQLFQAILPECSGEHVDVIGRPEMRTSSVLFLEPDTPLISNLQCVKDGDINKVANFIAKFLGQDISVAQPSILYDVMIFHSIEHNPPPIGLTAVRLSPIKEKKRNGTIVIPLTVMDIVEYIDLLHLWNHLQTRLKRHPFIKNTPTHYVESIVKNKSVIESYETSFLKDRELALNERLRISQLSDFFSDKVKQNCISLALNNKIPTDIEIEVSNIEHRSHKYHVLDRPVRFLKDAKISVKKILEQLKEHENAISDYLRDSTTIEATRVNLLLQSKMKLISIIVIIIAILTLFTGVIGILPDEIKTMIFEKIFNCLNGESSATLV